jgi:hypothetical protein
MWMLIGAAIVGGVWLATWLSGLGDANACVMCRSLFAKAKTLADTAAADLEEPSLAGGMRLAAFDVLISGCVANYSGSEKCPDQRLPSNKRMQLAGASVIRNVG